MTRVYKAHRKSRAKTSYGSYKQNIKKLEKKGYIIDKEDILKKKDFEKIYNEWKARGKKNIARDLATDTLSYRYQKYQKYIESYKKKKYKLLDVLQDKQEFADTYRNVKAAKMTVKQLAEYSLAFTPSFAQNYAKSVDEYDDDFNEYFDEKKSHKYKKIDEETGEERAEYTPINIKKLASDIMSGNFEGPKLFRDFVEKHNGYYYDERGEHILDSVREAFEGMYV